MTVWPAAREGKTAGQGLRQVQSETGPEEKGETSTLLTWPGSDVTRKRIVQVLGAGILLMVLLNIPSQVANVAFHHDNVFGLVPAFDIDTETSVQNWFSMAILLLAASMAAVISVVKQGRRDPYRYYWWGVTAVLAGFSAEETVGFHGVANQLMKQLGPFHGVFYFAWVIPGMAVVAFLGLGFLKLWWNLPQPFRTRFLVATVVYFGCAIGFELVESVLFEAGRQVSFAYSVFTTIEESGEMIGALLMISLLQDYLASLGVSVQVRGPGCAAPMPGTRR